MPPGGGTLEGRAFGRLSVTARAGSNRHGQSIWKCLCVCGKELVVPRPDLISGHTRSCGCLNKDVRSAATAQRNTTHGLSKKAEYTIWKDMHRRCRKHKRYAARGISVCERWTDFALFLGDVGPRPGLEYSLDRIDNNGDYEPGNCRWATRIEQNNNTRQNTRLTFQDRTQTLAQWARETGVRAGTIGGRLKRGWTVNEALSTPVPGSLASAETR